jgi:hypothetical protein
MVAPGKSSRPPPGDQKGAKRSSFLQATAIFIWEVAELLVFAQNRTHGIHPIAHIFNELIITMGALAYTGLSIFEVFAFRGYRSIVEFAVVTGLCAIVS